jgi:hypothetical protein
MCELKSLFVRHCDLDFCSLSIVVFKKTSVYDPYVGGEVGKTSNKKNIAHDKH